VVELIRIELTTFSRRRSPAATQPARGSPVRWAADPRTATDIEQAARGTLNAVRAAGVIHRRGSRRCPATGKNPEAPKNLAVANACDGDIPAFTTPRSLKPVRARLRSAVEMRNGLYPRPGWSRRIALPIAARPPNSRADRLPGCAPAGRSRWSSNPSRLQTAIPPTPGFVPTRLKISN